MSVSRHIHMTKKYLCTVGVFCCLTLYNSTGDHTCCFIVWPMASPAYEAQEYSPPAGTIILPSALWHFPPHSFHSAALTHTTAWLTFARIVGLHAGLFHYRTENFGSSNIPCSNSRRQTTFTVELLHFPTADLWLFLHYRSWIALSDTSL